MLADSLETRAERVSLCKSCVRIVSFSLATVAKIKEVVQSGSESRGPVGGGSEALSRLVVTTEETECAVIDPGAPAWIRGKADGPCTIRA